LLLCLHKHFHLVMLSFCVLFRPSEMLPLSQFLIMHFETDAIIYMVGQMT
jgi:hypothetical protein